MVYYSDSFTLFTLVGQHADLCCVKKGVQTDWVGWSVNAFYLYSFRSLNFGWSIDYTDWALRDLPLSL
jgi:hypothetical protein